MIISRTPFRISFFGGGTDYPAYFTNMGGAVLSTTIDKYCYISARILPPFFTPIKFRIVWSHIEGVSSIDEILHPAVKTGLHYAGYDNNLGLEIHHQGDLPARSGIGSSSSFVVGLLKTLYSLKGIELSKHDLACKAIDLEQNWLKEKVGCQDQIAASYGGFNKIVFDKNGRIDVHKVNIPSINLDRLNKNLLLFYTGRQRLSSKVASDIVQNINNKKRILQKMFKMVNIGEKVLIKGNLDEFGSLLDETWTLKQQLSPMISGTKINQIYKLAKTNGALGGKLLGAGGSGFMVFYVPQNFQEDVKRALSNFIEVPFGFDSSGCKILLPEEPESNNKETQLWQLNNYF